MVATLQGYAEVFEHFCHASTEARVLVLEGPLDIDPLTVDGWIWVLLPKPRKVVLHLTGKHGLLVPVSTSHNSHMFVRILHRESEAFALCGQPVVVAPISYSKGVTLIHHILSDAGQLGAKVGELGVDHRFHIGLILGDLDRWFAFSHRSDVVKDAGELNDLHVRLRELWFPVRHVVLTTGGLVIQDEVEGEGGTWAETRM